MKTKIAFIYDFDKTLSPKDIQEYSFLPEIGIDSKEFWGEVKKETEEQKSDNIISYMGLMIKRAKANNKEDQLTKTALKEHGEKIELFDGVKEWFGKINCYAHTKKATIEHYIISAGNKEILKGVSIAGEFKKIYGCSFMFDKNGVAKRVGLAINYTNKTQFIFRINKGILEENDHSINDFMPYEKRPIPFENMVYFGDGYTDIPCMRLVKEKGGYSIAVYPLGKGKEKVQDLLKDGRINFYFPANYKKDKNLYQTCQIIIDKMVAQSTLSKISQQCFKEVKKNTPDDQD